MPSNASMRALASVSAQSARVYPDASALERQIASRFDIAPERVVVTNGGDDAIDRVCRSVIAEGDLTLIHTPTFEMIPRGVSLAGGVVDAVDWLDGEFPLETFLARIAPKVKMVAVVSPNNPTGRSLTRDQLRCIIQATSDAGSLLMVDLAYVEFAQDDPQAELLTAEHVVSIRTFSKAFGMAGLRVGYAITSPTVATWLRTVGGPFPVSSPSLAAASAADTHGADTTFVERVRYERESLREILESWNVGSVRSDANFLLARVPDAIEARERLLRRGVSVRAFSPERESLIDRLRITLPGHAGDFARLVGALHAELAPNHPNPLAHSTEVTAVPNPTSAGVRTASVSRRTRETSVSVDLRLDGPPSVSVSTGLPFFDHMLTAFATHARIGLELVCEGDLQVDDHHTIEDCALTFGQAIDEALGDRSGIERFAHAFAPLDESLARVVIDLSGRPACVVELSLVRDSIGPVATENLSHFFRSLATTARMALHVDVLRGENDHHRVEAAFKALAIAFRGAVATNNTGHVASTKGVL